MQARHLCEDHLFAAIENRDQDYAEKLVRMIQSYQAEKKPLLTAKNDQGKSFLYLAMENKLEILADTLYHYLGLACVLENL